MAINKFFKEAYGGADIKLAYQKLVRKARRAGVTFEYTFEQFQNRVMRRFKDGFDILKLKRYTLKQALAKEIHSTAFTSYSSIAKENILNSIKDKFPDVYKEIVDKIGRVKQYGKFVPTYEQLYWDKEKGKYTFVDKEGNKWLIDITNSPEEVFIEQVEG